MSYKPPNWEDYSLGKHGRKGSTGSPGSNTGGHVQLGTASPTRASGRQSLAYQHQNGDQALRHRQSSLSVRMGSIAQIGGVNSIENFARSWQRALNFNQLAPIASSYRISDSGEDEDLLVPHHTDEERPSGSSADYAPNKRSLLRQQLQAQKDISPEEVIHDDPTRSHPRVSEREPDEWSPLLRSPSKGSPSQQGSDYFFSRPQMLSPFASSFRGAYGSFSDRLDEASRHEVVRHFHEQYERAQRSRDAGKEVEHEPLLVRQVEDEDGRISFEVIGQSTIQQTILNSTNVLIGVGILSLPLAIRYAGWLVGLVFLTWASITTSYTARLLGKCLDADKNMLTFSDIALYAFGPKAQIGIGILFILELFAACVALFVLFADSLILLIPALGVTEWKAVCGLAMIPLSMIPLRLLGYSSTLGIFCCIGIVILVITDGIIKPDTPGSLREPAATYLFPMNWSTLPLSLGLFMAPWGGHGVFPNIYRDMRHPQRYGTSLKATFGFTYFLDATVAVVGLIMFGDDTRDEITSNILTTDAFPRTVSIMLIVFIAIIPLTKLPLNAGPITATAESLYHFTFHRYSPSISPSHNSPPRRLSRIIPSLVVRVVIIAIITILAIVCPGFDRVMALMGSAFCFTICIIFPILFYLKIYSEEISVQERILDWVLIAFSGILAVIGTVWAFLPASMTGAD